MGAMGIRLATWNVNSLRQRLDHLARFAAEAAPDLICLQETKVTDAAFPRAALRAMGYPHLMAHVGALKVRFDRQSLLHQKTSLTVTSHPILSGGAATRSANLPNSSCAFGVAASRSALPS